MQPNCRNSWEAKVFTLKIEGDTRLLLEGSYTSWAGHRGTHYRTYQILTLRTPRQANSLASQSLSLIGAHEGRVGHALAGWTYARMMNAHSTIGHEAGGPRARACCSVFKPGRNSRAPPNRHLGDLRTATLPQARLADSLVPVVTGMQVIGVSRRIIAGQRLAASPRGRACRRRSAGGRNSKDVGRQELSK
jgi:hypothetical protein